MSSCHEMKKGEVYLCKDCGLELKVVVECKDAGEPSADCGCCDEPGEECALTCCGTPLEKKA